MTPQTPIEAAREDLQADMAFRSEAAIRAAQILFTHAGAKAGDHVWLPSVYDILTLAKFILDEEEDDDNDLSPEDQLAAEILSDT